MGTRSLYDTGPRYHDEADAGGRIVAPFLRAPGIRAPRRNDRHAPGQRPQRRRALAAFDRPGGRLCRRCPRIMRSSRGACSRRRRCGAMRGRPARGRGTACASRCCSRRPRSTRCASEVERPLVRRAHRIRHGSALLTGDLEARGEQELVRQRCRRAQGRRAAGAASRQPHVVDAGVHRRGGARLAVYTPGYRNRFGHPRPDIVARYEARAPEIPDRSRRRAHVHVCAGTSRTPRAEREHDRRYWYDAPVRERRSRSNEADERGVTEREAEQRARRVPQQLASLGRIGKERQHERSAIRRSPRAPAREGTANPTPTGNDRA